MNTIKLCARCFCALLAGCLIFGFTANAWATVNVTDFGAKGDLLTLANIGTVSNSTAIACSSANFSSTDVGKLIEVFGGGTWQGISNETLVAYISTVASPSNIAVSVAAGATVDGLTGAYGTDDRPAFNNAIAACATPTDTVLIPSGDYLLVPSGQVVGDGNFSAITLRRGGLTFAGQGQAILTDFGGWKDFNGNCERGSLFEVLAPVTNDYPLVFTNLTLYGGNTGYIGNIGYPPSNQTGIGWDGTHHAYVAETSGSSTAPLISHTLFVNCTIHGWRGEMLIGTTAWAGGFMTVSNCVFYDGNATALNIPSAHDWSFDTFSNMFEIEEFYRSYATNASVFSDCLFTNLYGNGVMALNGGYYNCPTYTIQRNTFYSSGFALFTTPACDVLIVSNQFYTSQGLGLGSAGYQGTTINSNIVVADNLFSGTQYPISILGNGQNMTADVQVYSNEVNNAWGFGNGYGYSTNVTFFGNYGTNVGGFTGGQLQGQYFIDDGNQYRPLGLGDAFTLTNIFSYGSGRLGQMNPGISAAKFALSDSNPEKIPAGATLIITNASSETYPLYLNSSLTGTPVTMAGGVVKTFAWMNGVWQLTQPYSALSPPTNLHPLN